MSKDSWNPNQYERFKNERSQPFFDLLGLIKPIASPKVVDLGCGTGELTQILHKTLQASATIGVDNSDAMLEKAKSFEMPGLNFVKGQLESFGEESAFDIVFSNAAIQWVGNHPELLARIRKCLKPGGQVAIQLPANFDYPSHTVAHALGRESKYQKYTATTASEVRSLKAEDYASLLFNLGFTNPHVRLQVYGHVLNSKVDVVEWVKGTLLTWYQSRLPGPVYDEFLDEYKKRLMNELEDTKPFFYPFKRILMWAQLAQ